MEQVILVDENDNEIGLEEKMTAHVNPAKLHRAFSIFILNDKEQLLIQKRGNEKKTWPGYWSNSCCSHPGPNEPIVLAAQRRLKEELGFWCDLKFLFKFQYQAKFNKWWGEHELDHVFSGKYNGLVHPNPREIDDFSFVDIETISQDMDRSSNKYTPWFKICFKRFLESLAGQ